MEHSQYLLVLDQKLVVCPVVRVIGELRSSPITLSSQFWTVIYRAVFYSGIFDFDLSSVPVQVVYVILGGWPAPLLFDWKEFQWGEHFLVRFFAIEKMNNAMGETYCYSFDCTVVLEWKPHF